MRMEAAVSMEAVATAIGGDVSFALRGALHV
jgi:hypothetical protein